MEQGETMDYYRWIFKRKSFHLFHGAAKLTREDLAGLEAFLATVVPLTPDIKIGIRIVNEAETTCRRGADFCILFYSEKKDGYLRNIGYIGEQIDLYLASQNIGALWFGIGKPDKAQADGLDFVIMMAIAGMPEDKFRQDMFRSKRKPVEETWCGETLGVAEIVRFAPSACNTQPWITENTGDELMVYRYKKPGKRGIMPADRVRYYNKIDMGIYLFFLEVCLSHEGCIYRRRLYEDTTDDSAEKTLIAAYRIVRETENGEKADGTACGDIAGAVCGSGDVSFA